MPLNVTARQIIDEARTQDARFFSVNVPDGALLMTLNTTQRNLLLQYGTSIEGLLDQSTQVAAVVSGGLVGIDPITGLPYYITTQGTGYAVQNAGTPTVPLPYYDFTQQPISLDPFGASGGTPGFPLPADMIKLIHVTAAFSDGYSADVAVIPEKSRYSPGTHDVTCFLNGNRLVPVRRQPVTAAYPDWWASVTAVTTSYIGMITLTDLDTVMAIPVVLHAALIAAVAELLARTTPECNAADRAYYAQNATSTGQAIAMAGIDILGDVVQSSVIFRG